MVVQRSEHCSIVETFAFFNNATFSLCAKFYRRSSKVVNDMVQIEVCIYKEVIITPPNDSQ